MAYKTIIAVLDSPKTALQVTRFASALARQYDAHVIGLHAERLATVPIVAPMEIPDPVSVQALQDMAREETKETEAAFRSHAQSEGISHEWRSFVTGAGFNSQAIIDSARSVDLVIAVQTNPDDRSEHRADLETFLFESGRPVIMIPYVQKEPQPIKRVLIAWNGSREAARATFDALPLLKSADQVEIFSVDPVDMGSQSAELAGAEIAATLARHGVKATLATDITNGVPASSVIENRLSDSSIDLLVMGAYSHSRLWELLFGGVTRAVMESMTAPTLLSR
ncbi:universal stress protein [Rhizobiaceae bacterium n13]|uniref:Universal stress protein n=1 Tax=Ferirhizobium litorale TaxID=2927786 RepID=A0AAE3U191_9HYPH|nr:universal stress protein [Fererhizobium litorale]MDI7865088.1 universal stress protein [Fererhizobium litorale]MDI7922899.1 universal stress protein [Fererhizobium litorale]